MRKSLVLMLVLVLAASVALLAGCGDGDDSGGGDGNGDVSAETNGEVNGNGEAAAGEGEGQEQAVDEGGKKITVEESTEGGDSGTVTVEGEEGQESTIEVQEQAPSEEALGAPIYPNAQYVEGSGVSGTTTSGDKQLTATGAEFVTSDSLDKVVNWYKGKLGEPMASSPEESNWMYQDQDGRIITVIVKLFEGKTNITIATVSGDIDINL